MNLNKSVYSIYALFSLVISFSIIINAGDIYAQSRERTAQLTIANNTEATVHVEIQRQIKTKSHWDWQVEKVILPPLKEKTLTVPAGVVRLVANAFRSSPAKGYEEEFALSAGRNFTYNITPQKFGTSFLADRPEKSNSGITINHSKVILNGSSACRQTNRDKAPQWVLSGAGGSSFYYEAGQYLCRYYKTGFYLKGEEYLFYGCNDNFKKCYRNKRNDAFLGQTLDNKPGKESYEFIWKVGKRIDNLYQN